MTVSKIKIHWSDLIEPDSVHVIALILRLSWYVSSPSSATHSGSPSPSVKIFAGCGCLPPSLRSLSGSLVMELLPENQVLQSSRLPTGSQAAVLSRLVSMSTQSSLKIWLVPFPHCSVILVNGQKSPGGKMKSITTVYTRCSILWFFLKRTQHALHLMDCRCENWLRSQNQLRECDFPS